MPARTLPPRGARASVEALGDRRALPSIDWLTRLLGVPEAVVRRALAETADFVPLEREVRKAHREAGRDFYAQFRAPLELFALTRIIRPQHVVETGVSSGVSSMHFLLGLKANGVGTLHSIDLPSFQRGAELSRGESIVSIPPGRTSGWAIPPGVADGWDLKIGTSQEWLPRLVAELPQIDLFLHDSLHTPGHLTFELETIRPKLSPGAVVLADNTEWTGEAFPRFARRMGVPVVRRGRTDLVGLRIPAPVRPQTE